MSTRAVAGFLLRIGDGQKRLNSLGRMARDSSDGVPGIRSRSGYRVSRL